MCQSLILSQKGKTVISHCAECGTLNIWHQNLLLCFSTEQFRAFGAFSVEMDFSERAHPFPDGEDRAILCTPNKDINFAFTQDEWEDFKEAMEEAVYMEQVYQLFK